MPLWTATCQRVFLLSARALDVAFIVLLVVMGFGSVIAWVDWSV